LYCLVFQINNLKCKNAKAIINTNEKETTNDNQSPFNKAGIIKSYVAIGVFGCGTRNIRYIKNETLKPPAPKDDKKHIGENFFLKIIYKSLIIIFFVILHNIILKTYESIIIKTYYLIDYKR
jgi:hypothetical protein